MRLVRGRVSELDMCLWVPAAGRLQPRVGAGLLTARAHPALTPARQALLPTTADPRLWVVQCRPGREREAVMQLLQKSYTLAERGAPIAIRSAVCHDHLKGYFYVEADKESHVSPGGGV